MPRKVRALVNPKSGFHLSMEGVLRILKEVWDVEGISFGYEESTCPEDGQEKARQAVGDGVDTLIVVGGDGMINTIGAELIGTDVALAVIPTGSGNGFARHFEIPLHVKPASMALRSGRRQRIDVGIAGGHPFFVTCGLAWEADLVRSFQKSPIRGIPSYVFAGIHHFFTYEPQTFHLNIDGADIEIVHPLVMTVANLTEYGGGVKIAPNAQHDDGTLKLIAVPKCDPLRHLTQFYSLFQGRLAEMPEVVTCSFREMKVERERADPIQLDGELYDVGKDFSIHVQPAALEVVVPAKLQERVN
jgi:YegS/Rv2252/BmrU family lipid kinase